MAEWKADWVSVSLCIAAEQPRAAESHLTTACHGVMDLAVTAQSSPALSI